MLAILAVVGVAIVGGGTCDRRCLVVCPAHWIWHALFAMERTHEEKARSVSARLGGRVVATALLGLFEMAPLLNDHAANFHFMLRLP